MLNHSIKNWALCATLAVTAGSVWAQTSTTPTPDASVGVTPGNAREATQKAVPREDTGSLVRTDPSAADRAQEAARNAQNALTPDNRTNSTRDGMPNTVGSTNSTGANQTDSSLSASNNRAMNANNRLPRADRN